METNRADSDRSNRDYWLCQLGGWGLMAVYGVASSPFDGDSPLRTVKLLCVVTALGLSHLWRGYLHRRGWLHRNQPLPLSRIALGVALLALVQTAILVLLDALIRQGKLIHDPDVRFLLIALTALWFVVFAIWTLCFAAALSRRRAMLLELQKLEQEVSVKDTELRALQAQVNPHFFFNSLNTINSLVYQDPSAATLAIARLAEMMRYSLESGQKDTVSLEQELRAIDAYLGMEKLRFEDRLQLSTEIARGLDAVRLPPMALQTLVENAIKYGVERSIGPCRVRIEARRDGDVVKLIVTNDGRLAKADASTGIGLANTRKRLALIFGPQASCSLVERDGWVIACMELPRDSR